jgi:transposase
MCDRLGILRREQDANPVEDCRSTRLGKPAARLARCREMLQITAQMRVLVAIEPVDGRKGIDSLARLCQEKLAEDSFSGCVFVFRSRSGTAIRLLSYDGQGYWLAQKRLSKGRFVWWPEATGTTKPLEAYEAQLLMAAGDLWRVRAAPMWRRVSVLK